MEKRQGTVSIYFPEKAKEKTRCCVKALHTSMEMDSGADEDKEVSKRNFLSKFTKEIQASQAGCSSVAICLYK